MVRVSARVLVMSKSASIPATVSLSAVSPLHTMPPPSPMTVPTPSVVNPVTSSMRVPTSSSITAPPTYNSATVPPSMTALSSSVTFSTNSPIKVSTYDSPIRKTNSLKKALSNSSAIMPATKSLSTSSSVTVPVPSTSTAVVPTSFPVKMSAPSPMTVPTHTPITVPTCGHMTINLDNSTGSTRTVSEGTVHESSGTNIMALSGGTDSKSPQHDEIEPPDCPCPDKCPSRPPPHPNKRLLRSQSLPVYTAGVDVEDDHEGVEEPGVVGYSDTRGRRGAGGCGGKDGRGGIGVGGMGGRDRRATMTQHYYPEGGWGWVVVLVASIIHALTHGLHMAFGALLPLAMVRFSQHATALVHDPPPLPPFIPPAPLALPPRTALTKHTNEVQLINRRHTPTFTLVNKRRRHFIF
ncbi:hypothetical protein Pmani_027321 [Petrolisthes manimaculis]|uniref:Uncharacterized protein n=1 Tax=Petrolisthes manimaculis TaxID=1843537 RepID=A0AAE1P407_9EUCA|nr:hypothetical protein Pmani_027321 [Petrolisthes manimaculis]